VSDHKVGYDPNRAPERQGQRRHLFVTGMAVGLPDVAELKFDVNRPHTFCNICGAVYQTDLDRTANTAFLVLLAENGRKQWSHEHSATHSAREHKNFRDSGRFMTPEAATKLVPLGIIPLSDQLFDDEVDHAARTAPRAPVEPLS